MDYQFTGTHDFGDIQLTDFVFSLADYYVSPSAGTVQIGLNLPDNVHRFISATVTDIPTQSEALVESYLINHNNSPFKGSTPV